MPFKIKDNQIDRYFHDGEIFENVEDAVEELASYHNVDFEEEDDAGNKLDIWKYMERFKSPEAKMEWLQNAGDWDIEEINEDEDDEIEGFKCPICKEWCEYELFNNTHIWKCTGSACAFIGFEFYHINDVINLKNNIK